MRVYLLIVLFLGILLSCRQSTPSHTATGVSTTEGLVTTAHPVSSKVGAEILANGGNAFDAAVAVHMAMAVCYPKAGNIGGGGFAVLRTKEGEVHTLDFREMAPGASSVDMYLDEKGDVIDGLSIEGPMACGVPGSVKGMMELHKKFGKLSWAECLNPAIRIAEKGFTLTQIQTDVLNEKLPTIKKYNSPSIPYIKEKWTAGDSLIQPVLAETMKRIQQSGGEDFYTGQTAEAIVACMQKKGGIISMEDLANYHAVWRDPIHITLGQDDIYSMPPPSSGGVAIAQLLKGASHYDYDKTNFHSVAQIQLNTELEKRVYADRATYLGDMDYVDVPIDKLISDDYLQWRFNTVSTDSITPPEDIKEGEVNEIESVETTHYSIVDKDGNAIAVTTTINGLYGNKVFVEDAGFFLNNEMDDFSIKPGVPNQFGLVGNEKNAIAPGKRMLSSMTPTLVTRNDKLFVLVGSPGGSTIITTVFQVLQNVLTYDMDMQTAVDAPRFHNQWLPDVILYEENKVSAATLSELEKMGYTMKSRSGLGRVNAIMSHPEGFYEAGIDKSRGDCTAYTEQMYIAEN